MRNSRVEPMVLGAPSEVERHTDEMDSRQARCSSQPLPEGDEGAEGRNAVGLIHHEERPAFDANVAAVPESREYHLEVGAVVVLARILLLDKDPVRRAMPNA